MSPYQIHLMALYLGLELRGARERVVMVQTGIAGKNSCPPDWHNQWTACWMARCNHHCWAQRENDDSTLKRTYHRTTSFCCVCFILCGGLFSNMTLKLKDVRMLAQIFIESFASKLISCVWVAGICCFLLC